MRKPLPLGGVAANETDWEENMSEALSGLLAGDVAVITGAAQGSGAAIALGLAASGASVILCDVNDDGVREQAERIGAARWTLAADLEPTLRALGERGDIIKTLHKAMSGRGAKGALASFALHGEDENRRVVGRLVERGLHNELTGEAYAIVEGIDGRAHYLHFPYVGSTRLSDPRHSRCHGSLGLWMMLR